MVYGLSYSMQSSSMLTSMGSWCKARTRLSDMSIHGFSHIPQITLRSPYFLSSSLRRAHYLGRVMLATIRDQGLCPCPHCLVPKRKLDQLGVHADTRNRISKACKYDGETVREAQRSIYDLGMAINGAAIQRELKATSAVPMLVSIRHVSQ
jgi:hypothetical protein